MTPQQQLHALLAAQQQENAAQHAQLMNSLLALQQQFQPYLLQQSVGPVQHTGPGTQSLGLDLQSAMTSPYQPLLHPLVAQQLQQALAQQARPPVQSYVEAAMRNLQPAPRAAPAPFDAEAAVQQPNAVQQLQAGLPSPGISYAGPTVQAAPIMAPPPVYLAGAPQHAQPSQQPGYFATMWDSMRAAASALLPSAQVHAPVQLQQQSAPAAQPAAITGAQRAQAMPAVAAAVKPEPACGSARIPKPKPEPSCAPQGNLTGRPALPASSVLPGHLQAAASNAAVQDDEVDGYAEGSPEDEADLEVCDVISSLHVQ